MATDLTPEDLTDRHAHVLMSSLPAIRPSQPVVANMSHFETLSRLTIGEGGAT